MIYLRLPQRLLKPITDFTFYVAQSLPPDFRDLHHPVLSFHGHLDGAPMASRGDGFSMATSLCHSLLRGALLTPVYGYYFLKKLKGVSYL